MYAGVNPNSKLSRYEKNRVCSIIHVTDKMIMDRLMLKVSRYEGLET